MTLSLENFRNECKDERSRAWDRYKDLFEKWEELIKKQVYWGDMYTPYISKIWRILRCPNCNNRLTITKIIPPELNPHNLPPEEKNYKRLLMSCYNCYYEYAREIYKNKIQH